jgi:hypothetical protein
MSHLSASTAALEDLDCIEIALSRIDSRLKLRRGQKTFKWFGRFMDDYGAADAAYRQGINTDDYGKCEHAITMDGCDYEIGLMPIPAGRTRKVQHPATGEVVEMPVQGWLAVYDHWGPGRKLMQVMDGKQAERLNDEYMAALHEKKAKAAGHRVNLLRDSSGRIESLEITTSD